MTNFEKYKDVVSELIKETLDIGVKNGQPHKCSAVPCSECEFNKHSWKLAQEGKECTAQLSRWLLEEAPEKPKIDWENLPIDTKLLIKRNSGIIDKRYYAGIIDGKPSVFVYDATSFSKCCTRSLTTYSGTEKFEDFVEIAED